MKTQVLPSKKRVDIVSVIADFSQLLLPGEILVSGTLEVLVFSGDDAAPEEMLDGGIYVEGQTLRHRIKLGIPGVVYQLIFSGVSDLENTYAVEARQAVLLDNIPAGPLYQVYYFTTPPYSLISTDAAGSVSNVINGALWLYPQDAIESVSSITSGTLRNIVIYYYNYAPEGVDSTSGIISADIRDVVKFYYCPPEGIDSISGVVSGMIKDVVIFYSHYPPEGIDSTSTIVSGTLV